MAWTHGHLSLESLGSKAALAVQSIPAYVPRRSRRLFWIFLDVIGPIRPILAVPTLDSLDFSEIRMWQVEMSNLFVALVPEIVHSATRRPVVAGKGEKQPKTHESS